MLGLQHVHDADAIQLCGIVLHLGMKECIRALPWHRVPTLCTRFLSYPHAPHGSGHRNYTLHMQTECSHQAPRNYAHSSAQIKYTTLKASLARPFGGKMSMQQCLPAMAAKAGAHLVAYG